MLKTLLTPPLRSRVGPKSAVRPGGGSSDKPFFIYSKYEKNLRPDRGRLLDKGRGEGNRNDVKKGVGGQVLGK